MCLARRFAPTLAIEMVTDLSSPELPTRAHPAPHSLVSSPFISTLVSSCFVEELMFVSRKQGEPESPKNKPNTRKPIFNVRVMLRVQFVIWATISTWEPKRTSNGNLPPSLCRIRLSCIQVIRPFLLKSTPHTKKPAKNSKKYRCHFFPKSVVPRPRSVHPDHPLPSLLFHP